MTTRLFIAGIALAAAWATQGCAPAVVAGGAAVGATAAYDRRTVGAFVDDEAIELKSRSAINEVRELKEEAHINVTSMNGVVLLTGEVPNATLRDQAINQVRGVQGVRRIVNELQIGSPTSLGSRSHDTWLTSKVKTAMLTGKDIESGHVKVVTENGVVYLMGLVPKSQGDKAAQAARGVGDVRKVVKLFEYID